MPSQFSTSACASGSSVSFLCALRQAVSRTVGGEPESNLQVLKSAERVPVAAAPSSSATGDDCDAPGAGAAGAVGAGTGVCSAFGAAGAVTDLAAGFCAGE